MSSAEIKRAKRRVLAWSKESVAQFPCHHAACGNWRNVCTSVDLKWMEGGPDLEREGHYEEYHSFHRHPWRR